MRGLHAPNPPPHTHTCARAHTHTCMHARMHALRTYHVMFFQHAVKVCMFVRIFIERERERERERTTSCSFSTRCSSCCNVSVRAFSSRSVVSADNSLLSSSDILISICTFVWKRRTRTRTRMHAHVRAHIHTLANITELHCICKLHLQTTFANYICKLHLQTTFANYICRHKDATSK